MVKFNHSAYFVGRGQVKEPLIARVFRCKLFGFTLSEVLITLGVIGVVAALTIPGLVASHQKKVYATSLKKHYSTIINTFKKAMADDMVSDFSATELGKTIIGLTSTDAAKPDFEKQVHKYFANATTDLDKSYGNFNKSDAIIILPNVTYKIAGYNYPPTFTIYVDVNGVKNGPNKTGYDLFAFRVDDNLNIRKLYGDSNSAQNMCKNGGHLEACFEAVKDAGWEIKYF